MSLCADKLGITLDHVGDVPDVREISNHLLNVTRFFDPKKVLKRFLHIYGKNSKVQFTHFNSGACIPAFRKSRVADAHDQGVLL